MAQAPDPGRPSQAVERAGTEIETDEDLFAHVEALKGNIAVVPQKDVLHDGLTVGAALRYTAELRLPPDLTGAEVRASVREILGVVGLDRRQGTPIRHLSGSQVRRASLANEVVARPSLLFLDEVTSGLDEQADREIMELFREVADGGKPVVCITQNLANVEATCHLVAILAEGGRLAFIGTPEEAKSYFDVPRLGEVYRRLAGRPPEDRQGRFRASPPFRRHVADSLPTDSRIGSEPGARPGPPPPARRGAGGLRQAWVLIRRYAAIWSGDRPALLALLGQGLLVAALLALVFGDLGRVASPDARLPRTLNLLLMLAVSCFWFGCNTAAKELVKERGICRRERAFNLRVGGYLASKFLVLGLIGVARATLLFGIVRAWCGPLGSTVAQGLVLARLALAGTAVGLLLSACAATEEVATALVPMAVVPQIILAGVIAPRSGPAEWLARGLITLHWGQEGLERLLPAGDRALLGRPAGDWSGPLALVLAHAAVVTGATLVVVGLPGVPPRGGQQILACPEVGLLGWVGKRAAEPSLARMGPAVGGLPVSRHEYTVVAVNRNAAGTPVSLTVHNPRGPTGLGRTPTGTRAEDSSR